MKRRIFVVTAGAVAAIIITSGSLFWRSVHQPPARPVPVMSRADQIRQNNVARQKKDGIIAPNFDRSADRDKEEKLPTQQARLTQHTSLTLLDLSRAPTEDELIKAGQLQEPLSPTTTADPAKLSDPAAKARQEVDNLLFGQAMNAWNRHQYAEALPLFLRHLKEFPRSPWAAESRLHLGLASLQQGHMPGCLQQVDFVLKDCAKGSAAYQKAMMLKAMALVREQRPGEAANIYSEALATETDTSRRTTAASWLLTLSQLAKQ